MLPFGGRILINGIFCILYRLGLPCILLMCLLMCLFVPFLLISRVPTITCKVVLLLLLLLSSPLEFFFTSALADGLSREFE